MKNITTPRLPAALVAVALALPGCTTFQGGGRDLEGACKPLESQLFAPPVAVTPAAAPVPAPAAPAGIPPGVIDFPGPPAEPVVTPGEPARHITIQAEALFATSSHMLTDVGRTTIDREFAKLGDLATIKAVTVTGHTDSRGGAAMNQALSERRAGSVKAYLVSKGIPAGKIATSGMGLTSPIADNQTDAGRAKNRRVEVEVQN